MAEHNQRFDSFTEWVNKASSWLTRHPDYTSDKNGVSPFRAICFDAKGRLCRIGADFQRARDEDCFPVHWLWPDQIGELFLELEFWRDENASAAFMLAAEIRGRLEKGEDTTELTALRLNPILNAANDAREGRFFETCEACGQPILAHEKRANYDDAAVHAVCAPDVPSIGPFAFSRNEALEFARCVIAEAARQWGEVDG